MKSYDKFDINSFISPDVACAPVYVWVWNDVCTRETIDIQLGEMQRLGIRAFYILPEPKEFRPDSMPTSLSPDYLSAEYLELCAYAIEKAENLGMNCWIYDEGGWPSGGACSKVLKEHPEYARQTLEAYERSFEAGDIYKKTSSDFIAAFLNNRDIIEDGYRFSKSNVVTEYVAEKESCPGANYPDLLNREATEYFIEITHKKYAAALKNTLKKTVTAVFTDEPKAPFVAFNKELEEKYEEIYNESVIPHLPLIAENVATTEENAYILHRWYDLCSKMFCENFLLPCKKWAHEHGISFTGHMDMDHSPLGCMHGGGNFNLMRALRCFDIPGVDVIRRQIYPEDKITDKDGFNGYNGFFPRYASSAAAHNGTGLAMSEILGVAGTAVTYDIMRYTVGYQAVRGINIFNLFNFPLGRQCQLLAQELPVFTENQPYYHFLGEFNRYVERLSYISSLGNRVCQTGLYYPVSDFQGGLNTDAVAKSFDTLGRTLEEMTVDFDIVDNDVLQTASGTDKGYFCIGSAQYRQIIIPQGAFIPQGTQTALNRFVEGGGRVLHTLTDLEPVIQVEGEGLRAIHRKTENADIFCLFREKGENGDYQVHLPAASGYMLDLSSGAIQSFESKGNILRLSLSVGETAVILLTEEKLSAESKTNFTKCFSFADNFTLRKETELVFGKSGFECVKHCGKAVATDLGDWSNFAGKAFSGSCVYETCFTLPAKKIGKEGELDLGDVHFAASVYLNDRPLGTAFMPPYKIKIPADVLSRENTLKISVTNTSANLYAHTDYFDKWSIKELSPYFEDELVYSKAFESGGLYGPVTLYIKQ